NIHRFPESKDEDEWGVKPDKGYEIKLSDEERLEYLLDRRDRDIVRKAGQDPPKEKESDKKKEPFKDKVLEKALEYIKGELSKQGAARQAPAAPAAGLPALPAELPALDATASAPRTPALGLACADPARGLEIHTTEHRPTSQPAGQVASLELRPTLEVVVRRSQPAMPYSHEELSCQPHRIMSVST